MEEKVIRIVLVDDHQMMREGVRRMLSEQPGMQVVGEAASGEAALEQVRATNPDLVIMDIHLPGEGGIESSARILAEFPGVKLVVLSADTELATVQKALQVGVSGYITKAGSPVELIKAVQAAMDERVHLSQEVAEVVVQDYMKMVVGRSEPAKPVLTDRERLLLKLVAEGKRNKEIAEALRVGTNSVETYRSRLMRKLNCRSAAELIRYGIREGYAAP
jgi:DNA-binding NarL/FixJ family response regulator